MLKNRLLIFPSPIVWLGRILAKIVPDQVIAFFCYFAQKRTQKIKAGIYFSSLDTRL